MQVAAAGYIRLIQARLERILDATLLLFEVLYGSPLAGRLSWAS